MKRVDVAVVGAGHAATTMHIPAWKKLKQANLIAVCDVDEERAKSIAKAWGIPRVYTDFNELLEKEKNAIIDICTPPPTHAFLSVEAMRMGHNVVLEKPMAMSYDECKKIMDEYQRRKKEVKLSIVHNFLFTRPLLGIRSIINEKGLDILRADIIMLHTPTDEMISDRTHWVHKLPGGRFGENLIHPVYVLRNLIGRLNLRDIFVSKRGHYDWVKYDELHVTFNSENKYGTIYISFNSPRVTNAPLSLRVYGKQLIINYDGSNLILTKQGSLPQGKMYKVKDNFQYIVQIMGTLVKETAMAMTGKGKSGHYYLFSALVQAILENKDMPYTPEEAFDATITFLEVLQKLSKRLEN
ncbi:MAG: Gfo/Idh/MocA family protein [Candidatus Bathyarchaeia archaeon]